MNNSNLILNTDSYKASHYLQYPPGTEYVSSYVESRGGRYPETLFFGLQAFLKAYLLRPITRADIDEAESVLVRVLPDYVRVIQGDGINPDSITAILAAMKSQGQSAENIAFGMGGAMLQKVNRDTQRFAMKASALCIQGQWRDVYKDPVTDPGKRSKAGRLALLQEGGQWRTVRQEASPPADNRLGEVFRDGELRVDWRFDEIRARARQAIH